MSQTDPKAVVGRSRTGYDRPVTVNGVLMGHASFAKCYPTSWWNYQPVDGGRLEQHADLSRVRDKAVLMYKRQQAAEPLPPIQSLKACPHCSADGFYVEYEASGTVSEHRLFNGQPADNTSMYGGLRLKALATAFCSNCFKPIARWNEDLDIKAYK